MLSGFSSSQTSAFLPVKGFLCHKRQKAERGDWEGICGLPPACVAEDKELESRKIPKLILELIFCILLEACQTPPSQLLMFRPT